MLALPATASAHAELVSSDPAANASLAAAPERLSLTFTEPIDAASAAISLLDTRQAEIHGVGGVALDAAGTTASAALPALEPGVYTVSYQVTSAVDGHITTGIFAFLVDPTGTEPAPTVPTEASSLSTGLEVVAARWLGLAAALAAFGILLFWLVSARPVLLASGATLARAPWGAVAAAAALGFAGLSSYLVLAARPLTDPSHPAHTESFPLDVAGPFGWTPFAIAMRIALAGTLATFLIATAHWVRHDAARRRGRGTGRGPGRERGWLLLTAGAAVLALAGMSLAGHAAAIGGPLSGALDLAHLLGVGAWLGTLPGLFLLVRRDRGAVPGALRLHSRVALIAAPVVVLTGLAASPLVIGSAPRELVASGYGNLLLSKALLFSVAVGIGAANFFLVRRGSARALPLIAAELVVGAVAVLAAAGMVTGQPAANRVPVLTASAIGAAHLYGTAGESSVHAAVNLPAPGEQTYQVSVTDTATGAYRTDVQRVILTFTPPADSGLPAERVELSASGSPGLWGTLGSYTPVVGDWQLEVIVRRVGQLDETASFALPVAEPLPPVLVPPPDIGVGVPVPLAALWGILPAGTLGWVVPVLLLAVPAGLAAAPRLRGNQAAAVARACLVVLAVVAGIGVGSREAVEAANHPPPDAAAAQNPVPAGEASLARGRGLFLANCAACHGVDGEGGGLSAEGMLPGPGRLRETVPDLTDGEIAHRIAVGTAGTRMPAFATTLSENDRWDLVNYLRATWPEADR